MADVAGEHVAYEHRQIDHYLQAMWEDYVGQLLTAPVSERLRILIACASVLRLQREHAEPDSYYPELG